MPEGLAADSGGSFSRAGSATESLMRPSVLACFLPFEETLPGRPFFGGRADAAEPSGLSTLVARSGVFFPVRVCDSGLLLETLLVVTFLLVVVVWSFALAFLPVAFLRAAFFEPVVDAGGAGFRAAGLRAVVFTGFLPGFCFIAFEADLPVLTTVFFFDCGTAESPFPSSFDFCPAL